MSLIEILLTIILISSFCLGLRTIMSEGQLIHFIREPFEYERDSKMMNFLRRKLQRISLNQYENLNQIRKRYCKKSQMLGYILKPFLLCVVCFPSFWGSILFLFLHGIKWEWVICIISSTFLIKAVNDKVDW